MLLLFILARIAENFIMNYRNWRTIEGESNTNVYLCILFNYRVFGINLDLLKQLKHNFVKHKEIKMIILVFSC